MMNAEQRGHGCTIYKILNRYALPYAAPHVAYAHAPVVYNALDSGLVYPVAEPYVHDATGEMCLESRDMT